MELWIDSIRESMCRYVGQTVTIFTTSGGLSGAGFTGVLICVDCNCIKLLADVGAPPACPIGSDCTGWRNNNGCGFGSGGGCGGGYGYGGGGGCGCGCDGGGCGFGSGCNGNPLGAVVVIPTKAVAAFTHNAI